MISPNRLQKRNLLKDLNKKGRNRAKRAQEKRILREGHLKKRLQSLQYLHQNPRKPIRRKKKRNHCPWNRHSNQRKVNQRNKKKKPCLQNQHLLLRKSNRRKASLKC